MVHQAASSPSNQGVICTSPPKNRDTGVLQTPETDAPGLGHSIIDEWLAGDASLVASEVGGERLTPTSKHQYGWFAIGQLTLKRWESTLTAVTSTSLGDN